MKTGLAYASNCSDSLYSFIYQTLQQRSVKENESLYQQAISACRSPKQKKKMAGYYAGSWQKLFNAWCHNRVPNIAVLPVLAQQCLSSLQCEELFADWN
ncbi:TPA: hypothetical protein JLP25_004642 [Escherichia coli]|uniref:hypothetical protein n=1 Tax=Escherichia coli TaxID=562 RepID=UPI000BE3CD7D|nr:hypothetical protein [Escherichia coli]EKR5116734.1 hypothetical protein [Escherichia coli]ELD1747243.1 hypothetical protein [Escherichia coli]ELO4849654.1 hypothetical protein [Escherichia coli]ELO5052443.1 hypothetical protein [Escherichia coli]MBN6421682.1 hypothetical protein [Escherichia coli]